jgi:methylenetetrahydrofolate reductase (NADPH)
MHGLETAPREATAAVSGFHLFPFGGLRKAGTWLRAFPAEARAAGAVTQI